MTNQKFYLTTIMVKVYSELPLSSDLSLGDIGDLIDDGPCYGVEKRKEKEISQAQAVAVTGEFFGPFDEDDNDNYLGDDIDGDVRADCGHVSMREFIDNGCSECDAEDDNRG